ncbi:MAG: c-type cytochrome biogenesis protein CcmI [Acetobacteraceae bacterium]|nr:c-type cytochrome biogenesis protein CcmI [Acetobacteraceae bacterium]
MLPLLFAAVAVVALVPLLLPLLRGPRGVAARASYDRAVYRDQLEELDRDVARGLIQDAEAASARLEIQRRLLATDSEPEKVPPRLARSPILAALLVLVVAGGAAGVYLQLGAPTLPDEPYAIRQAPANAAIAAGDNHVDMSEAAARLAERLASNPNDAQGWLLYGRTEAMLNQWDKAADAFRHAIALGQAGPQVQAGYGEMMVMQAQGIVTPAAHDAFVAALKADPKSDVARYYMALAAGQAGEAQKAIDQLQALAADLPADSGMREEIGKRVAEAARQAGLPVPKLAEGKPPEAAPGPDDAAMASAAQMPEADRKAMISGMVAKLAASLADNPNDLDGWMRLGRAYGVLGERDKSVDAYDHAATLKPNDPEIKLLVVETLLTGLQPADPFPVRAVALLRQVQLVEPEEPTVLWYLGVEAAREGHQAEARGYWTQLLAKLPAGEDADMVKAALEQVKAP